MTKFARILVDNKEKWGLVTTENKFLEIEGDIYSQYHITDKLIEPENVKILPPSVPTKIIAVGLNYFDHAKEMNMNVPDEPIIFLKPPSSIIAHKEEIIYPDMSNRVDYEAELAIIIKNKVKNITEDIVDKNILGYTCFNDITARDLQKKDGQWTRAKSFDTFSPIGPFIVKDIDPDNQDIKLYVNGEEKQNSNTKNFIFKTKTLVSFISKIMTLYPGDIITTGTPPGVGPLNKGDTVEVFIKDIGKLINYVK